ncbi:MAG TPA: YraN family protein [Bryobacteraceae bacterium]|nr:YraN family protein [Bryobacteraceae bacterium]
MTGWLCRLVDAVRHHARARVWRPTEALGRRGEDLAHRFLENLGYVIVARNWRGGGGEIDLVAWDREQVVCVEVKSRTSDEFASPERNVDRAKRRALLRAGLAYVHRASIETARLRFDVVSIVLDGGPRISHHKDAFRAGRTL